MSNNLEVIWEAKSEDVVNCMMSLKEKYNIGQLRAIELYGGDGHTLTAKMAEKCNSFVGYDINPDKEEGFIKNVRNSEFRCRDSVKTLKSANAGEIGTYNLISVDAPICIYGDGYCEHFEILEYIYKIMENEECVICVFPVVPKPYDTEKEENSAWMQRRSEFYGTTEINLNLDNVYGIYDHLFEGQGLRILDKIYVCREYRNHVDWMYEYMYVLQINESR